LKWENCRKFLKKTNQIFFTKFLKHSIFFAPINLLQNIGLAEISNKLWALHKNSYKGGISLCLYICHRIILYKLAATAFSAVPLSLSNKIKLSARRNN
jgi:hypothetical protein